MHLNLHSVVEVLRAKQAYTHQAIPGAPLYQDQQPQEHPGASQSEAITLEWTRKLEHRSHFKVSMNQSAEVSMLQSGQ